jgi:heme/copper-type cytochrome/quinol oxidase subunit 4
MAYELYYAFAATTTSFEFWCFILWFVFDVAFVAVALIAAYQPRNLSVVILRLIVGVAAGVVFLRWLCTLYPDDREQVTAFWVGVVLQFPISWGTLWLLMWTRDTRGHSLEIWYAPDAQNLDRECVVS